MVTLANLVNIFFACYSVNTKNQNVKNKCNHIKAHYFGLLSTYNSQQAMYKTRNTRTGNGMRRTREMGVMLYSGQCHETFRGMSLNILGNVAKHSREYRQTFWGMLLNILGNATKHSGECRQTFHGMPSKFQGMLPNILESVANFWCK